VIVLGFDTATSATAVGLRLADGATLRSYEAPDQSARPGHTTRLLTLASELLRQADLGWSDVQRIAVGVGPGTFTGLRIGVATARGLAQALEVDAVGVSTLQVLATSTIGDAAAWHAGAGVLAAIDARRGQVFLGAYAQQPDTPKEGAGAGRPRAQELLAPRAVAPADLAEVSVAAGGEREWLAVGDGAIRFREHLEAIGIVVAAEQSPLHRVDAGVLCELALTAPRGAPEAVLPDYRRRPDAEIALEDAEQ
jgi:tRNA threonylcarbamoyladenosine biosynthesis protein TsaB